MKVEDILSKKGRAVRTVRPNQTVLELAELLRFEHIGAAIVSPDEGASIVGFVSERDIAYGLTVHASRLPHVPVEQLMTKTVIVCSPEDPICSVINVMTQQRLRHLPVKANDQLIGIISIGDVLKHRLSEVQLEADVLRDYARIHKNAPMLG